MTLSIALILFLILGMFILFVMEILPMDVIALLVLSILLLSGFVTPAEGLSGFSNPAVITIAALFIISSALQKSGVLEYIIMYLNKMAGRNKYLGLTFYLISIAIASAVVNNTAVVAIFIPVTIRLAEKYDISPSKVLIPLSYAAVLGGTLTLIGTSTNLLVNSIIIHETNQPPLGMFEFSKFGIIKLTVGLIYVLFLGVRLLPSRTVISSLTESYHMGGFLTEVKIAAESRLIGKTCMEREINKNYDVTVLEILRGNKFITSNIRNTVLQEGDILFIRGLLDNFIRLREIEKVTLLTDEKLSQKELEQEDNVLVECLITDKSSVVGKSIFDINFRRRFGSFVLAIRREGTILRRKIAHILIKPFDTLLVFGAREKIREMIQTGDFIVLQEKETTITRHRYWFMSIIVIFALVALSASGILPIYKGALFGAVILMIFRLITPNEAYQSIHWQVVILIAALIPLAYAIHSSGTADWIGRSLNNFIELFNPAIQPFVFLALTYLLTMVLTEVSSNAATAVIITPIILATAEQMQLNPRPFIFAVCFAASASFITPVGYQTNLMVYGPGGYKFSDYIKVGLPLGILLWILAVIFIPVFWPFK